MAPARHLSLRPPPPLDAVVMQLWTSERPAGLAHGREWGLPSGEADLVLPLHGPALRRFDSADDSGGHWLQGGVLQGAMTRPALRDTAGAACVVGAHFTPAGLAALLPMPVQQLADRVLALDDLWPGWAQALRARMLAAGALQRPALRLQLLAQALAARLRPGWQPDALLAQALGGLRRGETVGVVQARSGLSPAAFDHRFQAACGLPPGQWRQLQRFGQALQLAHAGQPLAEVAAAAGYADQPHLARAFRRHAGVSAGQWRQAATAWPQHMAWVAGR